MQENSHHFYEFKDIRFYPTQSRLVRVQGGMDYIIRPKARDFLMVLLRKPGDTVTYEELRAQVWPEAHKVKDVLQTMRETKHTLDNLLSDISKQKAKIIQTVVSQGYCLNASVTEGTDEADALSQQALSALAATQTGETLLAEEQAEKSKPLPPEVITQIEGRLLKPSSLPSVAANLESTGYLSSLFGGHLRQAVVSCVLYSLLYAMALLLEIAYRFDRFGRMAVRLAPLVFLWIFITSLISLLLASRLKTQGQGGSLIIALLVLLGSGILLSIALGPFLPGFPVTEAQHQTHTAWGAYFKNVCYFLPLAVIFLLLPFHFIISLQREIASGRYKGVRDLLLGKRRSVAPENTIFVKVWQLGALLSGTAVLSLLLTFSLLNNITPSPYRNLFTQLVFVRMLLYFELGLECLLWYAHALNSLKRKCLIS